MAVIRVVKNKNYTSMSNYHLKDMRLSLKAKGLLSVILSLPENWDYSVHGLSYICKEGQDAIREAIRELENAGYVFRSRNRNKKGQLKNAEYVIYEEPQDHPAEADEESAQPMETVPMQETPMHETPALDNPALVMPTLEKQMQENPTQLNIYKTNTLPQKGKNKKVRNEPNPYPSNPDPIKPARAEAQAQRPFNLVEQMRGIVRNHISYDVMVEEFDREQLDEIVSIMVEVLCSGNPTYNISGEVYPAELVKERMCAINSSHIQYIFGCMKDTGSDIRNIKRYLLAALFNAPATISNYYDAKVRHDFGL